MKFSAGSRFFHSRSSGSSSSSRPHSSASSSSRGITKHNRRNVPTSIALLSPGFIRQDMDDVVRFVQPPRTSTPVPESSCTVSKQEHSQHESPHMIYDYVELSTDIDMSTAISLSTESEESSNEETIDYAELYEMECAKDQSPPAADESIEDRSDNAGFLFLEHFQVKTREESPAPLRPLLTFTNFGTAQPAHTPTPSPCKKEPVVEQGSQDSISYLSEYPTSEYPSDFTEEYEKQRAAEESSDSLQLKFPEFITLKPTLQPTPEPRCPDLYPTSKVTPSDHEPTAPRDFHPERTDQAELHIDSGISSPVLNCTVEVSLSPGHAEEYQEYSFDDNYDSLQSSQGNSVYDDESEKSAAESNQDSVPASSVDHYVYVKTSYESPRKLPSSNAIPQASTELLTEFKPGFLLHLR